MIARTTETREPCAPWAARLALFGATLIVVALVLHRISMVSTPTALNAAAAGFAFASVALALGLYAAVSIWVRGRAGAWSAAAGVLISAALWLWPLAYAPTFFSLPEINDISTDTQYPPPLVAAAKQRPPGANSTSYPGASTARLQARAYPDLKTLVIPRPAEDVYEIALDLIRGRRGLGWKVLAEQAPQARPPKPGTIEASDRTLILGFTDDIAVRISGSESEARLDIRSASRYGRHDFGANAQRIRRFVRELAARLDQAGPVGVASRGGVRINRAEVPSNAAVKKPQARK